MPGLGRALQQMVGLGAYLEKKVSVCVWGGGGMLREGAVEVSVKRLNIKGHDAGGGVYRGKRETNALHRRKGPQGHIQSPDIL